MSANIDHQRGVTQANSSHRRLRSQRSRATARLVAAIMFFILAASAVFWWIAPWPIGGAHSTDHDHEEAGLAIFDDVVVHPIPEDDFRPLSSVQDVQDAMKELERQLVQQVRAVDDLSSLPVEDQRSFARTAAEKVTPYLTGDFDTYFNQIALFGGTPPNPSSIKGVELAWRAKSPMLKFASIALEHAQTRRLPGQQTKQAFMQDVRDMFAMGIERPSIASSVNHNFYPAVADWRAKKLDAFEVRVPIRLTTAVKDKELRTVMIGVAFAQNPATGQWQPVETRLYYSKSKEPIPTSQAKMRERSKRTPGTLPL